MAFKWVSSNKEKQPKKKLEFMQKTLIYLAFFATSCTIATYVLAFLGFETLENLTIELNRLAWGGEGVGLIGYCLQNCMRAKWSAEKTANETTSVAKTNVVQEPPAQRTTEE